MAFTVLAPLIVLAALGVVLCRKAVHSALCLAAVMIGLAGLYAALAAPFLFAVQIIVYTGAVMMLFLFVIMLVGVEAKEPFTEIIAGHRGWAIALSVAFAAIVITAAGQTVTSIDVGLDQANADGNVEGLAALMFGPYILAMQFTAALFMTAVLGAMVLAHRERLTPRQTQKELSEQRMRSYAAEGKHPGNPPTPGVYARHNAVDTPALGPDGEIIEESVAEVVRQRGQMNLDSTTHDPDVAGEIDQLPTTEERIESADPPDGPADAGRSSAGGERAGVSRPPDDDLDTDARSSRPTRSTESEEDER